MRALEKNDKVQDVVLAEHQPSDNIAITSWEQRYSTMLPNEIKDFYLGMYYLKVEKLLLFTQS